MSSTWYSNDIPPRPPVGAGDAVVAILRGALLLTLIVAGLLVLLVLRLLERPVFGSKRPVTPWITQGVCRTALLILGIRYRITGQPIVGSGALVANHSSWLDIFALNAATRLYFVSKSEVAGWPGIGWLARATGTVFVVRDRKEARHQVQLFEDRLRAGHKLLFFPEGTSTDGLQVLPFKPTLFAAFFGEEFEGMKLQAVTVNYTAPDGQDQRFYGWWGDMDMGPHLWSVLGTLRQGAIEVVFHPPVVRTDYGDRKVLAKELETQVRDALTAKP